MYEVVNGSFLSFLANLVSQHVPFRYLQFNDANLFLLCLVLCQSLVIVDLVFVDLYFEICCRLISNVLKLHLNLKHY